MNKSLVITSIAKPTKTLKIIAKKCSKNLIDVLIIGDKKSPKKFNLNNTHFYSLKDQLKLDFSYKKKCPRNSYSRKNIGYLIAIKNNAKIIFDVDDDNEPKNNFFNIKPIKNKTYLIKNSGWINVYNYFSNQNIWPRGFPLSELKNKKKSLKKKLNAICPINQRLANNNPDVDAIYRLVNKIPFNFKDSADVALGRNSWCPFNSQNTIWHQVSFPLMYLPSFCTFRMSDIWRSLIAQRICWINGWSILYSSSTVTHIRNDHDLIKDFHDEIPGYLYNKEIAKKLSNLKLKKGAKYLTHNLYKCYKLLCDERFLQKKELDLLKLWISDIRKIKTQNDIKK